MTILYGSPQINKQWPPSSYFFGAEFPLLWGNVFEKKLGKTFISMSKFKCVFPAKDLPLLENHKNIKKKKHCSNIELTKIKIQAFKTQLLQLEEIMSNIIFYLIKCQWYQVYWQAKGTNCYQTKLIFLKSV